MSSGVKIGFSDKERAFMQQTDLLLTKRVIVDKWYTCLEQLRSRMLTDIDTKPMPDAWNNARTSRGENYQGLPYIILDHPRYFNGNNAFACRTMFWWGKHVSYTLHLQGDVLSDLKPLLISNWSKLKDTDLSVSIGDKPFEHHFEADNYGPLNDVKDVETFLAERDFLRIAYKIPVTEVDQTVDTGVRIYQLLLSALC